MLRADYSTDTHSPFCAEKVLCLGFLKQCCLLFIPGHVPGKGQGSSTTGSQAGRRPGRNGIRVYSGGSPFYLQILTNPWLHSEGDSVSWTEVGA